MIRSLDGVDDVAVIGIDHPTSGEVPRAFIVKRRGKKISLKDSSSAINDVTNFLNDCVLFVVCIKMNTLGEVWVTDLS